MYWKKASSKPKRNNVSNLIQFFAVTFYILIAEKSH